MNVINKDMVKQAIKKHCWKIEILNCGLFGLSGYMLYIAISTPNWCYAIVGVMGLAIVWGIGELLALNG